MAMDRLLYQATKDSSIVECGRLEDADAIARLDACCFDPAWSREHYREEISAEKRTILLVRGCGGGIVQAFLNARRVVDEIHIIRIATDPASRRCGHARALLQCLFADAWQRGCTRVLLDVAAHNDAALSLYRSLGFGEVGRRKEYYSDGDDAVLMSLDLFSRAGR